jgi:hypothetical protein
MKPLSEEAMASAITINSELIAAGDRLDFGQDQGRACAEEALRSEDKALVQFISN